MLVTGRIPGVDAVGVDRQLDRRPVRPELVRAGEPVEAPANRDQAPHRLDGETDRRAVAVERPARRRYCRPFICCRSHRISFRGICDARWRRAMPRQCQAVGRCCRRGQFGGGLVTRRPLGAEQEDREHSFARGEHGGCEPASSGAPPRGESPRDDLHQCRAAPASRRSRETMLRPTRAQAGSTGEPQLRRAAIPDARSRARREAGTPRRGYSLVDGVRPHVRGPVDQHRPEQRCAGGRSADARGAGELVAGSEDVRSCRLTVNATARASSATTDAARMSSPSARAASRRRSRRRAR